MKSNTVILIVSALIIAGGAYWYFSNSSGNEVPLTASSPSAVAQQTQFQTLVGQLQSITFSTSIFSDPKFAALQNLTTPISPEASGRLDPFAPISGVTGM